MTQEVALTITRDLVAYTHTYMYARSGTYGTLCARVSHRRFKIRPGFNLMTHHRTHIDIKIRTYTSISTSSSSPQMLSTCDLLVCERGLP